MKYTCISADSHIDLSWLPHDLFVSHASALLKARMPHVVQGPQGPVWTTKSGSDLGLANGVGSSGAVGAHTRYVPGEVYRNDRMAATGLFADSARGIFRPTTPELRLQDQDKDGIQAEVMYGLHNAGNKIKDREAAAEFYRIYNDWLADFCRYDPSRLVGLASIPSVHVEDSVAETRRVAKLGLRGLEFAASYDMTPLWLPYWDPFWQAAAEVNLPVHFHTIGQRSAPPIPQDTPSTYKAAGQATSLAASPLSIITLLAAILHNGALERYPNLQFVLGESGIGWIPYFLDRMDYEYEDRFKDQLELKMKPSEYWHRQCHATFQYDTVGVMLLDVIGIDTLMWASDYPHPDGVFPDSQDYIKRQFSHLSDAQRRALTCENAAKLYRLR